MGTRKETRVERTGVNQHRNDNPVGTGTVPRCVVTVPYSNHGTEKQPWKTRIKDKYRTRSVKMAPVITRTYTLISVGRLFPKGKIC